MRRGISFPNARTLPDNEWLDTRQVQPPVRNFRYCSSQHFHAKACEHFLRAIASTHGGGISLSHQRIVNLYCDASSTRFVLETVSERVKHLVSISDALSAEVPAKPL